MKSWTPIMELIFDELEGLFNEYYIDYDPDNFHENYLDFVKGVIDNNHITADDEVTELEDSVRFMVICDLLTLLRNESE